MIKVCALASGSNGNCYYIESGDEAIIIDAGISRRQIVERMKKKGLSPTKLKALFISQEHSDHYRGAKMVHSKLNIPVYLTRKTVERGFFTMRPNTVEIFEAGKTVEIGSFKIHSFLKQHDAIEPCSFRVEVANRNIGVFTDIGEACNNVKQHTALCDCIFLESNYDEQMLVKGKYPPHLKSRVSGSNGHLSNDQAADLIDQHASDKLKHILLSHISEDNNRGDIALKAFDRFSSKHNVKLTSRYDASEIIEL